MFSFKFSAAANSDRLFFMWDEDPRCQESLYETLKVAVAFFLVAGLLVAWWVGDWSAYFVGLRACGLALAALLIYATIVWSVGQSVKAVVRFIRKR